MTVEWYVFKFKGDLIAECLQKGSHPYIHGRPNQGEDHQMEVLPRGKGLGTLRSNESLVLS